MSREDYETALRHAVRAAAMTPLDENHQALLIRLYRLTGDDDAAHRQYLACCELFERELGAMPGAAVQSARYEVRGGSPETADNVSIGALVEAGSAAVSAGAVFTGLQSLRTAVQLADEVGSEALRVSARLLLAETLVHSLRGLDEEGLATLHEVDRIASANNDDDALAQARAELGYVDFLRARYDRAEVWLSEALALGAASPSVRAKATNYLGSVESDRGNYSRARTLLEDAAELARAARDPRQEAYGLSMLGRIGLLCGDLDAAARWLDASLAIAQSDHWLAFMPWPQALLGEVRLADGDVEGARELLGQAFARACQLGDPCWEGMSARGLALLASVAGDAEHAFALLAEARTRCNRLADPYVWLDAYILDAQCELGLRHHHPETGRWIELLRELASRTGMKELTVRSMLHGAASGREGDVAAALLLAPDVDSPALNERLARWQGR
jgi:tetratricopeptide (TPR) repeat protein